MSNPLAVCFGCQGPSLTSTETSFFREVNPLGFILFKRNILNPYQVCTLVDQLKATVKRTEVPILIDQEGGNVQRLTAPNWRNTPPQNVFAKLYEVDSKSGVKAAKMNARLIAQDLYEVGININCLPVLDIPATHCHPFLRSRVAGTTVSQSIDLGKATMEGLTAGGVSPVMKHMPGHGRATLDSHDATPTVHATRSELSACDFIPFKVLAGCPWGMTAHIIFANIDPVNPATQSTNIINDIIRKQIGFDGFLITDDISMGALNGKISQRALKSLNAGCDAVLHCNGNIAEMQEIASSICCLKDESIRRLSETFSAKVTPSKLKSKEVKAELRYLLSKVNGMP